MPELKIVDRGRNSKRIPHAVLVNRCPCCGQTDESPRFTVHLVLRSGLARQPGRA